MSTGLSFNQISEIINSALFQYFPDDHFVNLRIIAEPGRYFASSAFALVTNVIGTYITRASLLTNTGELSALALVHLFRYIYFFIDPDNHF